MINDFDDFCLGMYLLVDDIWQRIAPVFKRPGTKPECSDSELVTMALVGECRGWDVETETSVSGRNIGIYFPSSLRKVVSTDADAGQPVPECVDRYIITVQLR